VAALRFERARLRALWFVLPAAFCLAALVAGFDAAAVARAGEGKARFLLLERRYALLPGVLLGLGFWELDLRSGVLRLPLLRGCSRRAAFGAKLLCFQLASLGTAAFHLGLALLLAKCPASEVLTGETLRLLALRLGRDFGLQCFFLLPPLLGMEFFLRLLLSCAWAFCFAWLTQAGEPLLAWELPGAAALFLLAAPCAWLLYRKKEL
jgi:hypothetical protein